MPNAQQQKDADEFLRNLAERPFVALVMDEGEGLKVYTKGVSEEEMRTIQTMLMASDEES